jgi:hypothetical protein
MIRKFHLAKLLRQRDFEAIRADFACYPVLNPLLRPLESFDKLRTSGVDESAPSLRSGELRRAGRGACAPKPWRRSKLVEPFQRIHQLHQSSIEMFLSKIGVESDQVTLWGSGNVFREFLYVDDLANALIFLMQNYDYKDIGEIINIGVGQDLKIGELALKIKDLVEFEGQVKFDHDKPDGTPRKLLDVSKIFSLGWRPVVDLETGIKKSYQWYLDSTQAKPKPRIDAPL